MVLQTIGQAEKFNLQSNCQYKVSTCWSCHEAQKADIFCRSSNQCGYSGWIKIFAQGTKLIVTPPELTALDSTKIEEATLQLQLKTTSAYYTYLLLFFKSLIYSTIITFYLFGRPALYGNGKSSNTWWHQGSTCLHWLLSLKTSAENLVRACFLGLGYFSSNVSFSLVSLLQNRLTNRWVNRNSHSAKRTNSAMT
ncbi:uncharacterized protein LOC144379699 [Halichoerus grypus]